MFMNSNMNSNITNTSDINGKDPLFTKLTQ